MNKPLIALSLLGVPLAAPAQATTYDYTGAPLTTVISQASSDFGSVIAINATGSITIVPGQLGEPVLGIAPPIVPGNVLTDSITLGSPLAPNLVGASVSIR